MIPHRPEDAIEKANAQLLNPNVAKRSADVSVYEVLVRLLGAHRAVGLSKFHQPQVGYDAKPGTPTGASLQRVGLGLGQRVVHHRVRALAKVALLVGVERPRFAAQERPQIAVRDRAGTVEVQLLGDARA